MRISLARDCFVLGYILPEVCRVGPVARHSPCKNTAFTENADILENAQMTGVEFERYFDSLFANGFLQAGVSRKYEDHREPVSCNLLAGTLQAKTPPRQSARISRMATGPYHKWLGIPTDQHPASHYNDRATAHSSVLH